MNASALSPVSVAVITASMAIREAIGHSDQNYFRGTPTYSLDPFD